MGSKQKDRGGNKEQIVLSGTWDGEVQFQSWPVVLVTHVGRKRRNLLEELWIRKMTKGPEREFIQ